MTQTKPRKFMLNRRTVLKASLTTAGALAVDTRLSGQAVIVGNSIRLVNEVELGDGDLW